MTTLYDRLVLVYRTTLRMLLASMVICAVPSQSWGEQPPHAGTDRLGSELNPNPGKDDTSLDSGIGSRAVRPSRPSPKMTIYRPLAPQTWDALWAISWKRANSYYRIESAPTTLHDPMCRNPLMLDGLVHDTIQAITLRKYGDAVRFMSQFQDRSLCLTREGVRGIEFALSFYLHHALVSLPPPQAHIAVQGVLNLGMLTFDQLQYTRRSWWLLTIMSHAPMIGPHMGDYPRIDLGLWLYDSAHGRMVKNPFVDGMDRLIGAMRRVENFGLGTCALIDISEEGFVCQDDLSGTGMTQGGTGSGSKMDKFMRMPGSLPPNTASCVLQSVQATGVRGTMACTSKAMAGFTYNPRMGLQDKTIPDTGQAGIRDKMCALGQETGGDGTEGATATEKAAEAKEPSTWDNFKETVTKVVETVKDGAEKALDFVKGVFDMTPPVVSELGQGASKEGADAERGTLQYLQGLERLNNLQNTGDTQDYYDSQGNRIMTDPQAFKNQRLAGDGTGAPGGGICSARSNAAARAKALYQCIDKPASPDRYANPAPEAIPPGGQQQASSSQQGKMMLGKDTISTSPTNKGGATLEGGGPQRGGPQPTLDPTRIYVDPSVDPTGGTAPGSNQSGPLACIVQAGDLVRASLNDPRCDARMRCVGNQPCPCNRQTGPTAEQKQLIRDPETKPNCADGTCDTPDPMATPKPPPKPTLNFGGPLPPSPR